MKKLSISIILALVSLNIFSQTLSVDLGSIPATAVSQCTGKAWVQVTGGTAPYTFQWNTGDSSTYLENLCLGTYSVTVTDATNATAVDTVVFSTSSQIISPLEVYIKLGIPLAHLKKCLSLGDGVSNESNGI